MQSALQDHVEQGLARGLGNVDIDTGVLHPQFAQERRDRRVFHAAAGADSQLTAQQAGAGREFGLGVLSGPQTLPGVGQQQAATVGEHCTALGTVEKRFTEFALERLDLGADGRLGDKAPLRRAGERLLLGHRDEILQPT